MRRAVAVLVAGALLAVGGLLTAGAAGLPDRAAPAAAKPPPLRLKERCLTVAERKGVVRFTASDRTRLLGVMIGKGSSGVALAHGDDANLCSWLRHARTLAAAGYRVLVLDLRRYGSSGSPRSVPNLHRFDLDVIAATRELRRRGARTVVLAGASLGGTAVLAAAATIAPPVQGVISLSAPEVWVRVHAIRAVQRMSVPVLFVAAESDVQYAEEARALYAASASPDKRLLILPGGAHGVDLLRGPAAAGFRATFVGFIREQSARR